MNNFSLTALETEVLRWLLDGEDPVIIVLQSQLKNVTVIRRKLTGYGFYLYFDIPINLQDFQMDFSVKMDFCFGDVEAIIPSLRNGAGFLLWIKNGIISSLEGYTYDEAWPKEIKEFKLRYISGLDRDWNKLRQQWELHNA